MADLRQRRRWSGLYFKNLWFRLHITALLIGYQWRICVPARAGLKTLTANLHDVELYGTSIRSELLYS